MEQAPGRGGARPPMELSGGILLVGRQGRLERSTRVGEPAGRRGATLADLISAFTLSALSRA